MYRNIKSEIGKNIKQRRHARKWTQQMLAEKVKCDRSVIARVEKGDRTSFDVENLSRYAEVFGCKLVELLPDD